MSKKRKKNKKPQLAVTSQGTAGPSTSPVIKGMSDYYKSLSRPPCHVGPVEIVPNLFLGSGSEALQMPAMGVTTLIPLNSLNGAIWDKGFRGEILYYPTKDYEVLPRDVIESLANTIVTRLDRNEKIGLFCLGGHGRTGYVAAIVLGKIGYADPIEYVRTRYCKEAIESNAQIKQIADVLQLPELYEKYKQAFQKSYAAWSWDDDDDDDTIGSLTKSWPVSKTQQYYDGLFSARYLETLKPVEPTTPRYCKDCGLYNGADKCLRFDIRIRPYEIACEDAIP